MTVTGTLSFFSGHFVFESALGRTERRYDRCTEVRVGRAAQGYEVAVRVEFEERWRMTAADALAVGLLLLPRVVRDR
jgi:hypothetical protein